MIYFIEHFDGQPPETVESDEFPPNVSGASRVVHTFAEKEDLDKDLIPACGVCGYSFLEWQHKADGMHCTTCAAWLDKKERLLPLEAHQHIAVIDGILYAIGPEPRKNELYREGLGMAGRRFDIEFFDGRKVTTHNLWQHGFVPPKFRADFPDNARFGGGARRVNVGGTTCWNNSTGE